MNPLPSDQTRAGFLPGAHEIEGYGAGGFRFAGMSHRGSILVLPSGVYAWEAKEPADITAQSLALLFAEQELAGARGAVDHLLIGAGASFVPLAADLKRRLADVGIRAESMQTGAAARTFSILLGEKRRVAAALLAAP